MSLINVLPTGKELPASTGDTGRAFSPFLCFHVPPGCPLLHEPPVRRLLRGERADGRTAVRERGGPLSQLGIHGSHQQLLVEEGSGEAEEVLSTLKQLPFVRDSK